MRIDVKRVLILAAAAAAILALGACGTDDKPDVKSPETFLPYFQKDESTYYFINNTFTENKENKERSISVIYVPTEFSVKDNMDDIFAFPRAFNTFRHARSDIVTYYMDCSQADKKPVRIEMQMPPGIVVQDNKFKMEGLASQSADSMIVWNYVCKGEYNPSFDSATKARISTKATTVEDLQKTMFARGALGQKGDTENMNPVSLSGKPLRCDGDTSDGDKRATPKGAQEWLRCATTEEVLAGSSDPLVVACRTLTDETGSRKDYPTSNRDEAEMSKNCAIAVVNVNYESVASNQDLVLLALAVSDLWPH